MPPTEPVRHGPPSKKPISSPWLERDVLTEFADAAMPGEEAKLDTGAS